LAYIENYLGVSDLMTKRKAVVVEGFSGRSIEDVAGKLFAKLEELNLEVVPVEHMPYKGIVKRLWHAQTIEKFAEKAYPTIKTLTDEDFLILYSMGNLIGRYAIEKIGIKGNPTVILAGGPHLGCSWKYAPLFMVPCIRQMLPGSSFLRDLGLPKNDSYYYLVATQDTKVKVESACPVETDRVRHFTCGHRLFDHRPCIEYFNEIVGYETIQTAIK
jgi:hypothetical protein